MTYPWLSKLEKPRKITYHRTEVIGMIFNEEYRQLMLDKIGRAQRALDRELYGSVQMELEALRTMLE